MWRRLFVCLLLAGCTTSEGVYFLSPKEGETVSTSLRVRFGLKGKKVTKAGTQMGDPRYGHHHLIIDGTHVKEGDVIPMDKTHMHFGGGQTQTDITLTPGSHTLTLQLGDGAHISYGKAWSKTIRVMVQ